MQCWAECACHCPPPLLRHGPGPGCSSVRCSSGAAMWVCTLRPCNSELVAVWKQGPSRTDRLLSDQKHFAFVAFAVQEHLQASHERQKHEELASHCTWGEELGRRCAAFLVYRAWRRCDTASTHTSAQCRPSHVRAWFTAPTSTYNNSWMFTASVGFQSTRGLRSPQCGPSPAGTHRQSREPELPILQPPPAAICSAPVLQLL